jgi:signal transduction histidine kinase
MTLRGPAEIGHAAAAFNEMQARLARYVEDRTAMIAAIAHDLRTPLTRVQFKLQRAPADVAADIRSDLGQMEAMIAAVLAFVRDASPTQERGPLDLLSLLEVVSDDASATGSAVEMEPGPAVIVDGDASALQRLFVNLVDNAVKYGDRARIRLSSDATGAVVEIIDNGPGLTEAERDRVFEPFYRLEGSRNRDTGGIGLGLSIARSIARAHGGDVSLEPADPAPGLKAVVRLPVAKNSR